MVTQTSALMVSTRHLHRTTLDTWMDSCPWACYRKGEHGWFMYVPDDIDDGDCPADVELIIVVAKAHGCTWIFFDRDTSLSEEFLVYDR